MAFLVLVDMVHCFMDFLMQFACTSHAINSWLNVSVVSRVLLASLFIATCAQIQVPFFWVPMTMQAFAIIMVALVMPTPMAVSAVAAYIMEGVLGLPVFAGLAGGFHVLLEPTGGYIIGFLPMVYVISKLGANLTTIASRFVVCLIGQIPLYILGLAWLSTFTGFSAAIQVGFVPFILPGVCSMLFAIVSTDLLNKFVKSK